MGRALSPATKAVIYNVAQYFRKRKADKDSFEHKTCANINKIVAEATGYSERTVINVTKEANLSLKAQAESLTEAQENTSREQNSSPVKNLSQKENVSLELLEDSLPKEENSPISVSDKKPDTIENLLSPTTILVVVERMDDEGSPTEEKSALEKKSKQTNSSSETNVVVHSQESGPENVSKKLSLSKKAHSSKKSKLTIKSKSNKEDKSLNIPDSSGKVKSCKKGKIPKEIKASNEVSSYVEVNSSQEVNLSKKANSSKKGNSPKLNSIQPKFRSPKKPKTIKKKINIGDRDLESIKKKIYDMQEVDNKMPSIRKLQDCLKRDGLFNCGREYLRKLMHKMGYRFEPRKHKKKKQIEDQPNVANFIPAIESQITSSNLEPQQPTPQPESFPNTSHYANNYYYW